MVRPEETGDQGGPRDEGGPKAASCSRSQAGVSPAQPLKMPLPGWVVDNAASVDAEAAPYRNMDPEAVLADLAAVCRAGVRLLKLRDDLDAVMAAVDPLPPESARRLAELRARAAARPRGSGSPDDRG